MKKVRWIVAKNGHRSCIIKNEVGELKALSELKGCVAEYFNDSKVVEIKWSRNSGTRLGEFTLENGTIVSLHTLPNQLVAQALYGLTYYEATVASYNRSWGIA